MILLPGISQSQDTLICDNGGFESNFSYYFGEVATYNTGSDECTPLLGGAPVSWSKISMPAFRRFEITSGGVDTLVSISRTKFGSKAALINNRYGNVSPACNGNWEANKLVKRFKVTEVNRDFTIWFAAVLENPADHINSQPFFSIQCDRAPESNLCFDASVISCEDYYADSLCTFTDIDAVDWSCHRIKIPANMVDSIATLEVIAADCGCGAHFGYAYIDGICEKCEGSALGSANIVDEPYDGTGLGIKYWSCEGDKITVCGSFTLPTLCGDWGVDSIRAPGFVISNVDIDEVNEKFCLDLSLSDFPEDSCREFYVEVFFSSNLSNDSRQLSNTIELCHGEFEVYEADVTTGTCQDNGTTTLLSDDYYYLSVDLSVNYGDNWTMERHLDNPYPGLSGEYVMKAGTGPGIVELGPVLIQEGNWDLMINIGGCILVYEIGAPVYCSGCDKFYRTRIFKITCSDNNGGVDSSDPFDDWWSFTINVPGPSGNYYLYKASDIPSSSFTYGTSPTHDHLIQMGAIELECQKFILEDVGTGCRAYFIICPPKPCSGDCDLEAYVTEVVCDEEEELFYVDLVTSGAGSGYYCYESFAMDSMGNSGDDDYFQGNLDNPLGPFKEDVYIILYVCQDSACTCDQTCFQIVYVPKPDCENLEFRVREAYEFGKMRKDNILVIPNPVFYDELVLFSKIPLTSFEIYNSAAKVIHHGIFTAPELRLSIKMCAGLYIVKYMNNLGQYDYISFIKL